MHRFPALVLALLAASCTSAEAPAPAPPAPADGAARAEAAAKALGGALMKELAIAMKEGGPENAVRVCGDVAAKVAAEVSAREGIRVARTTLRTRNPANAPDPWERRVLEEWAASGNPEVREEVVGGEYRWMKPITVVAMCLPCHGGEERVGPGVAAILRERYPADAATGYREGDLRGAFTVAVPVAR